jgi:hypothetical protein
MTVLFFIGRKLFPRFALLAAIGLGLAIASWQGLYGTAGSWQGSSGPLFTMPQWSWTAFVNLALPLALLALTSQFLPGMAVLSASGYHIPARSPVTVLGLASIITAPLGGHGVTLAAIIAAICTGPEAHPDPQRRYMAGLVCGVLYIVLGIAGGALAGWCCSAQGAGGDRRRAGLVRHAGLIAHRCADGRRPPRSRLAYLCGGGIGRHHRRVGLAVVGGTGWWQRKLAAEGAPQKHAGHQAGDAGQKLSVEPENNGRLHVQAAISYW